MTAAAAATLARLRRVSVPETIARALARVTPRLRRRLLIGAAVFLLLAAAYHFWFRDSSFVAVERVTVTGLTTSDAERVRVALTSAGRTMTTLDVQRGELDKAVKGYPVVRDLQVTADFPHGLRVHVIEHHPVALAVSGSGRVPVAADGTILRGLPVDGRLPTVQVQGPLGANRLENGGARAAAAVAGAAPAVLRGRITEVRRRADEGLVAILRDGPDLIFGDLSALRAKWAAAARVLADLETRGAGYVDLRIPGRVAVGGLGTQAAVPVAPAATATTAPPPTSTPQPTTPGANAGSAATGQAPSAPTGQAPSAPTGAPGGAGTTTSTPRQTAPSTPVTGGAAGGAAAAPAP